MKSELIILVGMFCACVLPACVHERLPEPGREDVPSRFDQPAENFIYVGMPEEELLNLMGEPRNVNGQDDREIWYYEFGLVVLENSQVTYRYPPRPDAERSPPLRSQDRSDQH